MQTHNPDEIIQEALNLDGSVEKLQRFYAKWAADYDTDVAAEAYTAPQIIVDLFETNRLKIPSFKDLSNSQIEILDAGCGTGLIGSLLNQNGYTQVDGFDLSADMLAEAGKTGAYRQLAGGIDLNRPLIHLAGKRYDTVFCCGVFTLGHVPPTSLKQLFDAAKPGGLVLTSTRTRYYEGSGYQQVSDRFVASGRVRLLDVVKDGPYTADDNAHYWVYQVT